MKKYIVIFLFAGLFSACSDWLKIQPETAIPQDKMFETPQGFKDALTGCYMVMREVSYRPNSVLLAGSASDYMLEIMANSWPVDTLNQTTREYALYHHNYANTQVVSTFSSAFMNLYKIIANLNLLIEGIEKNGHILDKTTYNIVKGEALALRAYVHFDLIRLWGPMPTKINTTKKYLPYVTTLTPATFPYHTYDEYMEKLMTDLNTAEECLAESDPIRDYSNAELNNSGVSELARQSRMNYYAVLGLQARVNLWLQEKEEASRYAKLVINAKDTGGVPQFRLGDVNDFATSLGYYDGTLYMEHLFGVREDRYDATGQGGLATRETVLRMLENGDVGKLHLSPNAVALFDFPQDRIVQPRPPQFNQAPLSGIPTADQDIRLGQQMATVPGTSMTPGYGYTRSTRKFNGFYPSSTSPRSVPLIRLAEMYLIVMECGSQTEVDEAFATFMAARQSWTAPFTSETDKMAKIMKEYCKEFLGEGQVFYHYKRLGVEKMLFGRGTCGEAQYVLPLPPSEIGIE